MTIGGFFIVLFIIIGFFVKFGGTSSIVNK